MLLAFLLAQQPAPVKPDDAIGWAERMSKGGVPVICLCVAIAAIMGLIYVFMRLLAKGEEFKEMEKTYRLSLEADRKQDKLDAEKRLSEAKLESEARAGREMAMMKERLSAEKESDATWAHAVQAIENDTKLFDKVSGKLDSVDVLKRQLDEVLERIRRLEDRRA